MKSVAILAGSLLRLEIEQKKWKDDIKVYWTESLIEMLSTSADAYFDFGFENSREHITEIKGLTKPVFISEVNLTAEEVDQKFIRVNCWPGMISRPLIEIAPGTNADIPSALQILQSLGWAYHVVPDIPGFISCRIVATMVNEAYYTLQQGVSSRNEIDTAMKLGTNYPYGPFEWAEKIGISNITDLLNTLSIEDNIYRPAELLMASR